MAAIQELVQVFAKSAAVNSVPLSLPGAGVVAESEVLLQPVAKNNSDKTICRAARRELIRTNFLGVRGYQHISFE